jgi:hypothetical protein
MAVSGCAVGYHDDGTGEFINEQLQPQPQETKLEA